MRARVVEEEVGGEEPGWCLFQGEQSQDAWRIGAKGGWEVRAQRKWDGSKAEDRQAHTLTEKRRVCRDRVCKDLVNGPNA